MTLGVTLGVTPMHALPWYFGLAVFVVWSGAAAGLLLLVRRRIRARADRRRAAGAAQRGGADRPATVRDDRSLGPGADIEPW